MYSDEIQAFKLESMMNLRSAFVAPALVLVLSGCASPPQPSLVHVDNTRNVQPATSQRGVTSGQSSPALLVTMIYQGDTISQMPDGIGVIDIPANREKNVPHMRCLVIKDYDGAGNMGVGFSGIDCSLPVPAVPPVPPAPPVP